MILDRPPVGWKRPSILHSVRLQVLERLAAEKNVILLGEAYRGSVRSLMRAYEFALFGNERPEYDHRPPLSDRKFDAERNDTIPPANDPTCIDAITKAEHDFRTNGPGGEKRITSAGSDAHSRAKTRRLKSSGADVAYAHELAYGGANDLDLPARKAPKRKIPSRPFDKRFTKGFDGKVRARGPGRR